MSSKTYDTIRDEVLSACKAGRILNSLCNHTWSPGNGDYELALKAAADIHNAGEFDILQLFAGPEIEAIEGHTFFTVQRFFCDLLPLIDATVSDVIKCANRLVQQAGSDGAANIPYGSFREWCARRADRPREALAMIKENPDEELGVLSFVLEAGAKYDQEAYVNEAIAFVGSARDHERLQAITALGRIDLSGNERLRTAVLDTLETVFASHKNDTDVANAVYSLLEIFARQPNVLSERVEHLLQGASKKPGPLTLHAFAHTLGQHCKYLTEKMFDSLLEASLDVNPEHAGTIDEIDSALAQIDLATHRERIAGFLEKFLLKQAGAVSVRAFDSFIHKLLNKHKDILGWLTCKWFLKGDYALCNAIAEIVQGGGQDDFELYADMSAMKLTDHERVFVSRKALGYLIITPVAASSFLVSALRSAGDEAAAAISNLLFDPLLINYSGRPRELLETLSNNKEDPAAPHIDPALKRLDRYLESLRSIERLPELEPSERQRRIEMERRLEVFSSAFNKAQESSVLLSLVHKSVVLYGNRTVDYIRADETGKKRRIETQMHAHETSIDWPRLDTIDPVGLNYLILQFRNERPET